MIPNQPHTTIPHRPHSTIAIPPRATIPSRPRIAATHTANPNSDYVARYGRVGVAIAATVVAVSLFAGPTDDNDVAPTDQAETTVDDSATAP